MGNIKQPNLAALRAARAKAKAEEAARLVTAASPSLPTPESASATPDVEVVEVKQEKKSDSKANLDFFNQAPIAFAKILKKEKELKQKGRLKRKSVDSELEETSDSGSDDKDVPVRRKTRGKKSSAKPTSRPRKRSTTATSSSTSDEDSDPPSTSRRRKATPTPPASPTSSKRIELTPPPPSRYARHATSYIPPPTRLTRGRSSIQSIPPTTSTPADNTITLSSDDDAPNNGNDSDIEILPPPRIPTPPPPPMQEGPNPMVEILITRPNKKDSRIYIRKYRQTVKKVREQWCSDFNHNPKDIVLTFKGRRIFDYSTCRALNVPLREEVGEDEVRERIKLVAWRENEWEERRNWGYVTSDDDDEEEAAGRGTTGNSGGGGGEESDSEVEGEMLNLLLKGRDRQEWKIRVNKNSKVAKVIAKFKRENKIDNDKEVQLQFDGDELEEDVKLVDTEVEDDDCLDVIIS